MTLTSSQKRGLLWATLLVFSVLFLQKMGSVLTPFLVGGVLAYAIRPVVIQLSNLSRFRIPLPVSSALIVFLAMILAFSVALLIVPVLTQQLPLFKEQIPVLLTRVNEIAAPLLSRYDLKFDVNINAARVMMQKLVSGNESDIINGVLNYLRIGSDVASSVLSMLVLVPMVAYYLLVDWDLLTQKIKNLIPPRAKESILSFVYETDRVLAQYLRSQLLLMLILAAYYTFSLTIVGLDLALPVGIFTGLAIFIPFVGYGIGLVMAVMAAALEFQTFSGVMLVLGVYLVGQMLESFYLTPKLLGEQLGLHPLVVIFSLMAFGHVFGFVGILIALPVSAVLAVALVRLQNFYIQSEMYATPRSPVTENPPLVENQDDSSGGNQSTSS